MQTKVNRETSGNNETRPSGLDEFYKPRSSSPESVDVILIIKISSENFETLI